MAYEAQIARWKRPAVVAVAAFLPVILVLDCAPKMYPLRDGTSALLWYHACGAKIEPDRRYHGAWGWPGSTYAPRSGCFIYAKSHYHGEDIYAVPIEDATTDLPKVVHYVDEHSEDESLRDPVLQGFKAWAAADPSKSDPVLLIAKLREAWLADRKAQRPADYEYDMRQARDFDERWRRMQRYWLNVLFECLWLGGLVVWALWPWLRRSAPWRWGLHVGLVPFLLFLPYFLGYCPMAMTSAGPVGGVVYPWLLWFLRWLGPWLGVADKWLLENTPKLLGPLSQGTGPWMCLTGMGCIAPLGSLLTGALGGAAAFGARYSCGRWRSWLSPAKAEKLIGRLRPVEAGPDRHPNGDKRPVCDRAALRVTGACRTLLCFALKLLSRCAAEPRTPLSWRAKIILACVPPLVLLVYLVCLWTFVPDRMHEAARSGDIPRLRKYLDGGADPDEEGQVKYPIKFLGMPVWYASRSYDYTPLHWAIRGGQEEAFDLLLRAKADLEARNWYRHTALRAAMRDEHYRITEKLVTAGADLTATDYDGLSPLHLAARNDWPQMVQELIERGMDVMARARVGETPLHLASSTEVARILLRKGADPRAADKEGNTPLHRPVGHELVRVLVAAGADPNARNKDDETPLLRILGHYFCCDRYNVLTVRALLEAGADARAKDPEGNTPLHFAPRHEMVSALVKASAEVNAKNKEGDTPLHHAARRGQLRRMEALVAAGADLTVRNAEGLTPREKAQKEEDVHPLVIEFLEKAEARSTP